jgi:hypothetical protein
MVSLMLKDGKTVWGTEFTLPFGNFDVNITVPADHMMETTGTNRSRVVLQK